MNTDHDVEAGNCSACGADVLFVRSATSEARLILNDGPVKRVVITDGNSGAPLTAKGLRALAAPSLFGGPVTKPRAAVVDTFLDHHTTCPNAEQFRKEKPA